MKIETNDKNVWFEISKDIYAFIVEECTFGSVENPKTKEIVEKVTRKKTWHGTVSGCLIWCLERSIMLNIQSVDAFDLLKIIEDAKKEIISKIPEPIVKKTRKSVKV